jgi:hypothetical protein
VIVKWELEKKKNWIKRTSQRRIDTYINGVHMLGLTGWRLGTSGLVHAAISRIVSPSSKSKEHQLVGAYKDFDVIARGVYPVL